jgi:hypothetical protein
MRVIQMLYMNRTMHSITLNKNIILCITNKLSMSIRIEFTLILKNDILQYNNNYSHCVM